MSDESGNARTVRHMGEEPLTVQIVRHVHGALPHWLSGKQVCDAVEGKADLVFATLSNLSSKPEKGPLRKRRDPNRGGVLEYTTIERFDLAEWLTARPMRQAPARRTPTPQADSPKATASPAPRPRTFKSDIDEPEAQIVKALLKAKRRMSADELLACGDDHTSKEALVLRLAALVKPDDGVLEREREAIGKPWMYGVRRDIDIDAWLRERGASRGEAAAAEPTPSPIKGLVAFNVSRDSKPAVLTTQSAPEASPKPATPPVSGSAVPSKQGAEPVRVAATKTVAPQVPEAVRPGADDPPPVSATPSAAATVLKAAVAAPAVTRVPGSDSPASAAAAPEPAIPARVAAPAAAAAPKGDSFDIATEIALVAAANLAVMLHDFELPADVVRALSTFERAFAMQGRVQREARA
jgi:hypothetical protein